MSYHRLLILRSVLLFCSLFSIPLYPQQPNSTIQIDNFQPAKKAVAKTPTLQELSSMDTQSACELLEQLTPEQMQELINQLPEDQRAALMALEEDSSLQSPGNNSNQFDLPPDSETQEAFLKTILSQVNTLDIILQDLNVLLSNGALKVPDKKLVTDSLRNIQTIVQTIKSSPFAQINVNDLYLLVTINRALTQHILTGVRNGLCTLETFDMATVVTRTPQSGEKLSTETLEQEILEVNNLLEKLKKESTTVGLSTFNKLYRAFDSYIVDPISKYNMISRGAKLSILLAGATYFYYRSDFTKPAWFTNFVGKPHPEVTSKNLVWTSEEHEGLPELLRSEKYNVKWLGFLEHKLVLHQSGYLPFAGLFLASYPLFKTEYDTFINWVSKKSHEIANKCRGGAYSNIVINDLHRVLEPKATFDDLVGLDHAKKLLSSVLDYVQDPEPFDRANIIPEKGYLLLGESRTGKSFFAEAVAGEAKKRFTALNRDKDDFGFLIFKAPEIIHYGIEAVLAVAKDRAPCILFIDEIDLLGLQRAGGNSKLLSEFLVSMSGCLENDPKKQVIILAATNKPEFIDFALRKRGRFGKHIFFDYPNKIEREEYLTRKLLSLTGSIQQFDIKRMALETEKSTYEDMNAMIKSAFQQARACNHVISQYNLDLCLDEEIRHIINTDYKNLPAQEKQLIATYQAGQALSTLLFDGPQQLAKVTIRPINAYVEEKFVWTDVTQDKAQKKIEYGKIFTYHTTDTLNTLTDIQQKNQICVLLSGNVASTLLTGVGSGTYRSEDRNHALSLAKMLVSKGIDLDKLPKKQLQEYTQQALTLLEECERTITQLLRDHTELLQIITNTLYEKQTLNRADIDALYTEYKNKKALDTAAPKEPAKDQAKKTGQPKTRKRN